MYLNKIFKAMTQDCKWIEIFIDSIFGIIYI